MAVSLDSVMASFDALERRPAVFDREIREQVGVWDTPERVPVEEIVGAFKAHGGFTPDGERVLLPLHKEDSRELTGEYIEYRPDQPVTSAVYYDYGKGGLARIPFEEFGTTFPAWRLRFWHDATDTATQSSVQEATDNENALDEEGGPSTTVERNGVPAESIEGDAFFEDLRLFVEREREAEREDAREQFERLDANQYSQSVAGIPDLVGAGLDVDEYGQQIVRLRLPKDEIDDSPVDIPAEYGVYRGTEVLVDVQDEIDGFPIEAEVLDIEGRQLELGVFWDRSSAKGAAESALASENQHRYTLGELLNPVPSRRQLDAIQSIEQHEEKSAVVTGHADPSLASALDVELSKAGLNTYQYRAAQNALRANEVYCIHGPPGTGKTRSLVAITKAVCQNGGKVLACAHSNQAVDNLLVGDSSPEQPAPRTLHALAEDEEFTIARAGSNSENDVVEENYADTDIWKADIVCATMSGAAQFGEDVFDVAVIDEATQATIPSTLIPFSCTKRIVLAGDHKQLPPYHSSEYTEEEEMEISLFEHLTSLYGDSISTTLRTQYRMNKAIAAFPNAAFYDGILEHDDRNATWQVGELPPLEAYHVEGNEQETPGQSLYNHAEAKVAARQVSTALHAGADPTDIGVITPYSGQVGVIRKRIQELDDDAVLRDVKVSTIDSFQGSERDVIIISFVRSNPQGFSGFLTFPGEGPRRLNVALTRARKRCVLIGNFTTLGTYAPTRTPETSAAAVYRDLEQHLQSSGVLTSIDL